MSRERILVTTDLSQNSYKVIDKAMSFALRYDKWLEVLHVAEPALFSFGFAKAGETPVLDAAGQEKLLAFSDKIKKGMGRTIDKLNVETRLGEVATTVETFAAEKHVGLLVIGDSEHKGGIKEMMLGSTAKRIIGKSNVPVLVSKTETEADYKKIYVPTDFSDRSMETFSYLITLFPKATIILEHVIDVPGEVQLAFYDLDNSFLNTFTETAKKMAEEKTTLFLAKLRAKDAVAATADIRPQYGTGHIDGDWVATEAKKAGADLIGLTADTTLFSNTFPIMEKAHCDVLLYKA